MRSVVVKKSAIHGKGVFAAREFKKGEIVLVWKPKILTSLQVKQLSSKQKSYIVHRGRNKYFFMQSPERYMNYSCNPNTSMLKQADIAIKIIKKGQEITSNYSKEYAQLNFKCNCSSHSKA